jgi:putative phosphoribosyl transferase
MACMLPFPDRGSAGRLLAKELKDLLSERHMVLALPRGGVPVAYEIAGLLDAPLDVIVTRKIGYPPQPELGVGAIAENITDPGGLGSAEPVYDELLLDRLAVRADDLASVLSAERAELARQVRVYRAGRPPPVVAGRRVIVVDDGLATGVTARAALRSLRAGGAACLMLAVPVAPRQALESMRGEADHVVVLATPRKFLSVGEWYSSFAQLTDADVLELLEHPGS